VFEPTDIDDPLRKLDEQRREERTERDRLIAREQEMDDRLTVALTREKRTEQ
jgi:hypothetical protein